MRKWANKLAVTMMSLAILGAGEAFAETTVTISNNAGGKVSFGKVLPSSSGTVATGQDTLSISTNCAQGVSLYVSAVNGGGTALTNAAASATIPTVSASIGGAGTELLAGTWGLNVTGGSSYYGLPAYSATLGTPLYTGTATTLPIYYGVKVAASNAPGNYTGQVLYTALVNTECLKYTVHFDANGGTGTMTDQRIAPAVATALSNNGFSRDGYNFLGWSNSANGKTGTASNGVGTAADVDYANQEAVTDLEASGNTKNLYAIWETATTYFQDSGACGTISTNNANINNNTGTLTDSRDNQEYTVYRFPTTGSYPSGMAGYCIMTKDLSLGYVTGGSITRGANLSLDTTKSAAAGTITARTGTGNWSTTNSDDNLQYINGTGGTYDSHSYYSYGAAQKVCPKGWRPPTQSEYNNIVSFMGGNNSTGSSTIRGAPYNFVYGGYFYSGGWYDVGSYGLYWSSTQFSSAYGYFLYFYSSDLYVNYYGKNTGSSVRCVSSGS